MDDRLDRSKMYCRTSYHPPTRIEPSTDTGLNPNPENGLHAFATVGRVLPRGREGERDKENVFIPTQTEMEASAAMNQAPLYGCPEPFLVSVFAPPQLEGKSTVRSPRLRYRARFAIDFTYCRTRKFIFHGILSPLSQKSIPLINKFVDFFFRNNVKFDGGINCCIMKRNNQCHCITNTVPMERLIMNLRTRVLLYIILLTQ